MATAVATVVGRETLIKATLKPSRRIDLRRWLLIDDVPEDRSVMSGAWPQTFDSGMAKEKG